MYALVFHRGIYVSWTETYGTWAEMLADLVGLRPHYTLVELYCAGGFVRSWTGVAK